MRKRAPRLDRVRRVAAVTREQLHDPFPRLPAQHALSSVDNANAEFTVVAKIRHAHARLEWMPWDEDCGTTSVAASERPHLLARLARIQQVGGVLERKLPERAALAESLQQHTTRAIHEKQNSRAPGGFVSATRLSSQPEKACAKCARVKRQLSRFASCSPDAYTRACRASEILRLRSRHAAGTSETRNGTTHTFCGRET
eukprot:6174084-Pleurochrysis_carterae.AAC.3